MSDAGHCLNKQKIQAEIEKAERENPVVAAFFAKNESDFPGAAVADIARIIGVQPPNSTAEKKEEVIND